METQPAAAPAASAPPPAAAPNSSEPTAAAAANNTPPAVNVNANGTPGAAPATKETSGAPAWTDGFSADEKDFVTQRGFKDPKTVLESFRNLEKLRGVPADRLLKLPEAGDDKGMNEVFEKLGKPATPEGYGLKPENPEGAQFTDWAKSTFHKLNLTTAQGQELVKQYQEFEAAQVAEQKEAYTKAVQDQTMKLKKDWGAAYNQNVARAQAAYRRLGIPDTAIDSLEKSIGFDGVMRMFNDLGAKFGEHSFISGDGQQPNYGDGVILTPEQANARIKALKQDNDWVNRYLKKDVKAVAEMNRLMQMANPTD